VRGLAFTNDGKRLLSASHDGTLREWDVAAALRSGARLQFADTAYHGCESPDGAMLAVGFAHGDLRVFATGGGRELRRFETPGGWINRVQWSADGSRLMSAGQDGVVIWDSASGAKLRALATAGGVDCAALAADGATVAAVSRDNKARLWDAASGELRFELAFPQPQSGVALSPDGRTLAIAGAAGAALHDAASGAVRCKLEGHRGRVRAVEFHPGGEALATAGDDGTVALWRTADGASLATIAAHDNGVLCLDFSPDGKRLATGGGDDRLRLWDVATRAAVLTIDAKDMYCLSWNRDGTRLWVLPLAKEGYCLDAMPLRERAARGPR
jgi:dipeptidyl aminopeptidase/acylaminoacyl peptidase